MQDGPGEAPKTPSLGEWLFQNRDYTPIPLILLALSLAKPGARTATIGILLTLLGEIIRIYSVAFIGSISRTRKDHTGDRLITEGPFSIVRNPLYVGNFFISFGIAVYSGSVFTMILTAGAFSFQYFHIVQYEESLLEKKFKTEFDEYRAKVPAWIPRSWPQWEQWVQPDSYAKALKSEKRTLVAILATIIAILVFGR